MKIRIRGNSLRIRISRSEVDQFGIEGYLHESTELVNGMFRYALREKAGITDLEAAFEDQVMTMYVPAGIPAQWAKNERVGYSNDMDLGNGRTLFLLLEKDFKCLDNTGNEDQSDNFENPSLSC
jgi:hypothetical protein